MRILLAVIVLAALGWSGYWVVGKLATERGLHAWLAAREAEGWVVSHGGLRTVGFPNRFDTTITALELADPDTGVAWRAPLFQIFALSYRPNHVIFNWPDMQSFATPTETVTVASGRMRGSAVLVPGRALALDRLVVEFESVGVSSTAGWSGALNSGQLAMRRAPASTAPEYDIDFAAQDMTLPGQFAQFLADRGLASGQAEALTLDARVTFDVPWDRSAIEDRRPQPRAIDLSLARATWDDMDLRLAGALGVDESGLPEGSLTVRARNWREMLAVAAATGVLPAAMAPLVESGLDSLARMSGDPDTLDVPLRFGAGRVSLGGIVPLGRAPQLSLP